MKMNTDPFTFPNAFPCRTPKGRPGGQRPSRALAAGLLAVLLGLFLSPSPAWSDPQEETYANAIGMKFVRIPAGIFIMGSPIEEAFRDVSEIQHPVTISKAFYIQTTEVTVDQWRAVMGRRLFARKKGSGNMPVVKVSWHDCMKFIRKLSAMDGNRYNLPTEAQWEYAARAGSTTAYYWGNLIDCSRAMYANNPAKHGDCTAANEAAGMKPGQPAPVGRFKPNAWGLFDMHGNVWEWCLDRFDRYETISLVDPCETDSGQDRVRRGGSWFGTGYSSRSANRAFGHPMSRLQNTGFRLVVIPAGLNDTPSQPQ